MECVGPSCSRPAKRGDLCNTHYGQRRRTGRLWPIGAPPDPGLCAANGCDRPAGARTGLCKRHQEHVRKYGKTIAIGELNGKRGHRCAEPGCEEIPGSRYCDDHRPAAVGVCEAAGCAELCRSVANTYCDTHARQDRQFRHHHGISLRQRDALVEAQNGACLICREVKPLHYDHDHQSGQHRGMLCGPCNRGIGLFNDDPQRLESAAAYLRG